MGLDRWRKLKIALGINLCVYVPPTPSNENDSLQYSTPPSDAALLSPFTAWTFQDSVSTTSFSSRVLRFSRSLSRSSKKTCCICLSSMKNGDGEAVFTAECAHSFHFHCIASSVKYGNQLCPICRAKWNEIPLQNPSFDSALGKPRRVNPINSPLDNPSFTVIRRLPAPPINPNRQNPPFMQAPEPAMFNDDESLDRSSESGGLGSSFLENGEITALKIKTYPDVQSVPQFTSIDEFTILLNLKAPAQGYNSTRVSRFPRASVDLVTVLDVSGSMAGTKLALMKKAMGFVIQNLSSNDRLAVIAFSSTARRVFPLCLMSETGRQRALLAVNSLVANGGTNIAEGLRKGAKIMEDRREMNPVSSIILLSDGQDTYTLPNSTINQQQQPNYCLLLPVSIHNVDNPNYKIPVHAFGFGSDHDASSMHSISELSGGTFSFIETEGVIQDAFAQCIGGLLSVMIKNLHVSVESVNPRVKVRSLKTGSYRNRLLPDEKTGTVEVGDMYADEERNFLISINVPVETSRNVSSLFKVSCVYDDPLTKESVTIESDEVIIRRPEVAGKESESSKSVEVERQKMRIQAADAMARARSAAENGDLDRATSILEDCRKALLETLLAKSLDRVFVALDAELNQMQERLKSKNIYESSGRAYILSGLSSHSWQRATTRGDSIFGSSLLQSYQTPSMVEMLSRSQATVLGCSSTKKLNQPLLSFASQSRRR